MVGVCDYLAGIAVEVRSDDESSFCDGCEAQESGPDEQMYRIKTKFSPRTIVRHNHPCARNGQNHIQTRYRRQV